MRTKEVDVVWQEQGLPNPKNIDFLPVQKKQQRNVWETFRITCQSPTPCLGNDFVFESWHLNVWSLDQSTRWLSSTSMKQTGLVAIDSSFVTSWDIGKAMSTTIRNHIALQKRKKHVWDLLMFHWPPGGVAFWSSVKWEKKLGSDHPHSTRPQTLNRVLKCPQRVIFKLSRISLCSPRTSGQNSHFILNRKWYCPGNGKPAFTSFNLTPCPAIVAMPNEINK